MFLILDVYRSLMFRIVDAAGDWFLPVAARFSFAAVLLGYYWASAMTKFSDGFFGFLFPTVGAFYQILPSVTEAAGYDPSAISWIYVPIVLIGSWAEVILPLLIVVGLFTRGAALAMIGFIIVQSVVDVLGHDVNAGAWFDRASDGLILDQRLFWLFLLAVLVLKGAGRLSIDRLFGIDGD